MALLKLKDIGKIYASDGNVAVGIRGVNLSFDRGEFVAVTGQSGSGKSTLLNVISGMDTYEEGEMYVEGQPTSHYMQPDWEEYREKYISFIFQDYNIIDSFTVLQNVELALMHIEDKKQRRARAMELIERVGLRSHVKQKGSRLSGGQKQRTVIARALAKDSPIILADEPTGNLDSATSAGIIELLREVSKDKLVIVVTHNFEEVEACATRHVRVFDGAVESDRVLREHTAVDDSIPDSKKKRSKHKDIKNGIVLGRSIFSSRPRLSAFICLLLIVGTLGIFFVTAFCGEAMVLFDKKYMFTPIEGRAVVARRDGEMFTKEQLEQLEATEGVRELLRCDYLLDQSVYANINNSKHVKLKATYSDFKDLDENILGEYPSAPDEVLLYVPVSYKIDNRGDTLKAEYIKFTQLNLDLKVSGVKYYADNTQTPKCVFTREGFDIMTACMLMNNNSGKNDVSIKYYYGDSEKSVLQSYDSFRISYDVEDGKLYASDFKNYKGCDKAQLLLSSYGNDYFIEEDYGVYTTDISMQKENAFSYELKMSDFTEKGVSSYNDWARTVVASPYFVQNVMKDYISESYSQVSLFFDSNKEMKAALEVLNDKGYTAVSSQETYEGSSTDALAAMLEGLMLAGMWVLVILFLAFFINLCSSRAIGAFKPDMTIMRSMGISVRTIKVGMYVRMLISLIPAYIMLAAVSVLVFTSPHVNGMFTYLHLWQYVLIIVGMLILTARVTKKQIKKLFGESVKKALKGGASND